MQREEERFMPGNTRVRWWIGASCELRENCVKSCETEGRFYSDWEKAAGWKRHRHSWSASWACVESFDRQSGPSIACNERRTVLQIQRNNAERPADVPLPTTMGNRGHAVRNCRESVEKSRRPERKTFRLGSARVPIDVFSRHIPKCLGLQRLTLPLSRLVATNRLIVSFAATMPLRASLWRLCPNLERDSPISEWMHPVAPERIVFGTLRSTYVCDKLYSIVYFISDLTTFRCIGVYRLNISNIR